MQARSLPCNTKADTDAQTQTTPRCFAASRLFWTPGFCLVWCRKSALAIAQPPTAPHWHSRPAQQAAACPASVVQTDMPALALTTPLTRTFSKSRRFPCVLHTKRLRFTQEGSTHTKKAAACAPLRLRLRALSSCSVAWSPPPPACIRALSISRCLLRLHPLRAKPQNFTTSAKRSCNRQASQTSIADQAPSSLRARALLMRAKVGLEGDEAFRVAPLVGPMPPPQNSRPS